MNIRAKVLVNHFGGLFFCEEDRKENADFNAENKSGLSSILSNMSGPAAPYSTGTAMVSPAELQQFEAPLIALANLSGGDLRKLFHAFFSFLHARTDFYILASEDGDGGGGGMGFREGQAERILLASFRQFPLRKVTPPSKVEERSANNVSTGEEAKYSGRLASVDSLETTATIETIVTSTSVDSNEDTVGAVVLPQESDNSKKKSLPSSKISSSVKSKSKVRYTDEGKQVPIGNGGSTSRYVWTQTLDEVTVHIPIPEGVRAKDLDVSIGADSLSIHKTKKNVVEAEDVTVSEVNAENNDNNYDILPLEGTLFARIRPSESTWTLEDSAGGSSNISTLQLILEKVQKTWWETVISGDTPLIDATMVDSTRHIGTYDEETQAEIRRIMHDQRQERLGLPTSTSTMDVGDVLSQLPNTIPSLPSGVEYIDGETLDRASVGDNPTKSKSEKDST
jgi:hypothetical protein